MRPHFRDASQGTFRGAQAENNHNDNTQQNFERSQGFQRNQQDQLQRGQQDQTRNSAASQFQRGQQNQTAQNSAGNQFQRGQQDQTARNSAGHNFLFEDNRARTGREGIFERTASRDGSRTLTPQFRQEDFRSTDYNRSGAFQGNSRFHRSIDPLKYPDRNTGRDNHDFNGQGRFDNQSSRHDDRFYTPYWKTARYEWNGPRGLNYYNHYRSQYQNFPDFRNYSYNNGNYYDQNRQQVAFWYTPGSTVAYIGAGTDYPIELVLNEQTGQPIVDQYNRYLIYDQNGRETWVYLQVRRQPQPIYQQAVYEQPVFNTWYNRPFYNPFSYAKLGATYRTPNWNFGVGAVFGGGRGYGYGFPWSGIFASGGWGGRNGGGRFSIHI